ncbi:NAD-dependent epimerase/dehydratase family protein [Sphingobium yanoikuyae]|uniref:NAD-dependent epimerase/dehydratase family protein n=1 Tax=Sphingobium yanoikuyae TaxID=13690 RepID=UPI0022DCF582|nr:NAD-dependent epimerase/dehydratase family protein [Sphingobium yanoikuyae]WBQ19154.1 NAD(P)H-binding protein [Sphingobium yanoikuyae]
MVDVKRALIIGATGGVGGEVARALHLRGWEVMALHRNPDRAQGSNPDLHWVKGDAMDRSAVLKAAAGTQVIVHSVNPPGYRNWAGLVLPMLDNMLAGAKASRARVLLPGTIYNYGLDAGEAVDEQSPQDPTTRKGAIRVEMERRLRQASGEGVRALVVRAGDFYGPRAGNSWFAQGMVPAPGPIKRIFNPGRAGVGHAWAYLPDLAETMVRLLERENELADFDTFHFGGTWVADNRLFAEAIQRASGRLNAKIYPFPWPLFHAMAPFNETAREMREMIYLWRRPLRLVDRKLESFLGDLPATPMIDAVKATLRGLDRLGSQTK